MDIEKYLKWSLLIPVSVMCICIGFLPILWAFIYSVWLLFVLIITLPIAIGLLLTYLIITEII